MNKKGKSHIIVGVSAVAILVIIGFIAGNFGLFGENVAGEAFKMKVGLKKTNIGKKATSTTKFTGKESIRRTGREQVGGAANRMSRTTDVDARSRGAEGDGSDWDPVGKEGPTADARGVKGDIDYGEQHRGGGDISDCNEGDPGCTDIEYTLDQETRGGDDDQQPESYCTTLGRLFGTCSPTAQGIDGARDPEDDSGECTEAAAALGACSMPSESDIKGEGIEGTHGDEDEAARDKISGEELDEIEKKSRLEESGCKKTGCTFSYTKTGTTNQVETCRLLCNPDCKTVCY